LALFRAPAADILILASSFGSQDRQSCLSYEPSIRHWEIGNMPRGLGSTVDRKVLILLLAGTFWPAVAAAQDRLQKMPGYDRYQKLNQERFRLLASGFLRGTWKDDGKAFEYRRDGKVYHYDFTTRKLEAADEPPMDGQRSPRQGRPGGRAPFGRRRGPQAATIPSPDRKLEAFPRDRNLWLRDTETHQESPITSDGSDKARIRSGVVPWVYREELEQGTAVWWSPDSRKVAYYRFDESQVPDYYLALDQTSLQSKPGVEPYPKTGTPNPTVDLFIYDAATKKTVHVDARDGKPFDTSVLGHYLYHISWSPDGKELLFYRMNRRQNVMEFMAAQPETGRCRVILHEEWLPTWVEQSPTRQYLQDGTRFIWSSERTGWRNYYLYDLSGKLLATLTQHPYEVAGVVRVDEKAGQLYYLARSGDNPMKVQLHRVGLDGKGDVRLTNMAYHHTIQMAPDGRHFLDIAQTHDSPVTACLRDGDGNLVIELVRGDLTRFNQLGLKRVELFRFPAADGVTTLYGMLHRPSNFDPTKQYPLLVSVYAGPATNGARETFTLPHPLTEFGFLVATLDARSAAGRGKRFLDAIYGKFGVTEIDDLAAGVRALGARPYVDRSRVGIFGHSYGGYASLLCLLRHPDVFQAACASAPVTDFRLYDTIYTERYMGLPQENKAGYDAGSALTYAAKLQGRLLLYFGTADNNVHPSNSLQLIKALQRAGKSFDLQVGPDLAHMPISQSRMMEFFIDNLGQKQPL
jgi:dipeptidyl-peptidase-4